MFNIGATPAQSTAVSRLAGNAIHTVQFKGVTAEEVGKEGGEKYSVMKIKFANADGEFTDTIFEPKAEDAIQKDNNYGYKNPSNNDEMMFKLRHLIAAVNPKANEAIEKKGGNLTINTWADLRKFVIDNTTKGIGTEVQIKLVNDNKGQPRFPGFVLAFSKAGDLYPRTNFIGAKLAFTAKEQERINNAVSAVPTNMGTAVTSSGSLDLSADDLSLDIDEI